MKMAAPVLLLLSDMLRKENISMGIEIVAFNGEDHYSAGGEMDYLKRYSKELERVLLVINIDGVGYIKGNDAYSVNRCPKILRIKAKESFKYYQGIIQVE